MNYSKYKIRRSVAFFLLLLSILYFLPNSKVERVTEHIDPNTEIPFKPQNSQTREWTRLGNYIEDTVYAGIWGDGNYYYAVGKYNNWQGLFPTGWDHSLTKWDADGNEVLTKEL